MNLPTFLRNRWVQIGGAGVIVVGLGLGLGLAFGTGGSPARSANGAGNGRNGSNGGASGSSGRSTAVTVGQAQPGLRSCALADLHVTTGALETVSGHAGLPVVFTNTSTTECQLIGYPTVFGYAGQTRVGPALALAGGFVGGLGPTGQAGAVQLTPGASASVTVEAAMQAVPPVKKQTPKPPQGRPTGTTTTTHPPPTTTTHPCAQLTSLQVGVPGDSSTVSVPVQLTDCYAFLVHPFVPGTSGAVPH